MDSQPTRERELSCPNEDNVDPNTIKQMEIEEQAVWLGKWFGLQFFAWTSKFDMKRLETYFYDPEEEQGQLDGVVPAMWWTFGLFQISGDVFRNPLFHAAVQCCSLSNTETPLTSFKFRLGLRRFRYEVVSTLHTHALRIFGITDIVTINKRNESPQVAALRDNNQFLYAQGTSDPMERYLRSECIVKGGPIAICICQILSDSLGTSCHSARPSHC